MSFKHLGGVTGRWFFAFASWPFGVLEVSPWRLRIGVQFVGPLARLLGIRDVVVSRSSNAVVLMKSSFGAEFQIVDLNGAALSGTFSTFNGTIVREHLESCGWLVYVT